mmetsp:Transcript_38449/g.69723  ORF Transcript_38449/g.69723 Transcript_38449/m.69723 type:complete len:101 (-) Transcript_38449:727-1029(-)
MRHTSRFETCLLLEGLNYLVSPAQTNNSVVMVGEEAHQLARIPARYAEMISAAPARLRWSAWMSANALRRARVTRSAPSLISASVLPVEACSIRKTSCTC